MKFISSHLALAGLAAGQLILPLHKSSYRAFDVNTLAAQRPLTHASDPHREAGIKFGQSSKKEQDGEVCPSYGESQWTGTIDVSDERRLFYWFFDSRNDPANDPIILWMNGGPGGSSTMGLFAEMGPCWLPPKSETPEPNPWAWNANASLLFLDQPGGVGLSSLAEEAPIPNDEHDTAQDFQQFLNIFFKDVFPERKNATIHIAAESYGGHYGPVYVRHILESRRYDAKTAFWGNIESMILVDALLQWAAPAIGSYKLLCQDVDKIGVLNQSQCDYMATQMPEMHRLGRICDLADDAMACLAESAYCMDHVMRPYLDLVEAGKAHMYNSKYPRVVGHADL